METRKIMKELSALPPNAQREAVDFIAFLRARYATQSRKSAAMPTDWTREPFFGMWRDRADITDSSAWVRAQRTREWNRRNG